MNKIKNRFFSGVLAVISLTSAMTAGSITAVSAEGADTLPSYTASEGFSDTQGKNNWYYQYRRIDSVNSYDNTIRSTDDVKDTYNGEKQPLTNYTKKATYNGNTVWYDLTEEKWYAGSAVIGSNFTWPESFIKNLGHNSARTFECPYTGVININTKDNKGITTGDNDMYLRVLKIRNGKETKIWPEDEKWKKLTKGDIVATQCNINQIFVRQGDRIAFETNRGNPYAAGDVENAYKAKTIWDPVITYTELRNLPKEVLSDNFGEGSIDQDKWSVKSYGIENSNDGIIVEKNSVKLEASKGKVTSISLKNISKLKNYSYSVEVKNEGLKLTNWGTYCNLKFYIGDYGMVFYKNKDSRIVAQIYDRKNQNNVYKHITTNIDFDDKNKTNTFNIGIEGNKLTVKVNNSEICSAEYAQMPENSGRVELASGDIGYATFKNFKLYAKTDIVIDDPEYAEGYALSGTNEEIRVKLGAIGPEYGDKNITFIIAAYDSRNRLLDAELVTKTLEFSGRLDETVSFNRSSISGAKYIKVYSWNGFGELKPYEEAKVVPDTTKTAVLCTEDL